MASDQEQIPAELIDKWASYLPHDAPFRKACAGTSMHTLRAALRPVFATWKTSLMGSSVETLKSISNDDHICNFVEVLIIEDDTERLDPWASSELPSLDNSYDIWPRNSEGLFITSEIAILDLHTILREKRFPGLHQLKVRDYTISPVNLQLCDEMLRAKDLLTTRDTRIVETRGPTPVASFARDILEHATANLVLTSLAIQYVSSTIAENSILHSLRFSDEIEKTSVLGGPKIHEATIELTSTGSPPSPQSQTQQFCMLHSAKLLLEGDDATTTYWLERIMSSAPMLRTLELSFTTPFSSFPSQKRHFAAPRLEKFCLSHTTISAQDILTILSSSKASLVDVSFRQVTLVNDGSSWASLLSYIAKEFLALASFGLLVLRETARGSSAIDFINRVGAKQLQNFEKGLSISEKGTGNSKRVTRMEYRGVEAGFVLGFLAGDGEMQT